MVWAAALLGGLTGALWPSDSRDKRYSNHTRPCKHWARKNGQATSPWFCQCIITGLNKLQLYVLALKMALDADRA